MFCEASQGKKGHILANILIWMSPEPGHILPTVKISRDLESVGHKVVYQVPPAQQGEINELGFETIGFFDHLCRSVDSSLHRPLHSANSYYTEISRHHTRSAYIHVFRKELLNAAREINADLLIIDGVFDDIFRLCMHEVLPTKCRVARLWIHLPYRPIADIDKVKQSGPVIFLSPKDFEIPKLVCEKAVYTEGSPFEKRDIKGFPWSSIQDTRPIVYCSFGSQNERYADAEDNLRIIISTAKLARGYKFVVNAGILAAKLKDLTEQNVLILPHVPQIRILQRSVVMILHGGFGSIKDCIYERVPMLVIPQKWDQPLNAKRVNYHGIGLSLDRNQVTPQAVSYAIHTLVESQTFAHNLMRMRQIFVQQDERKPTAALLESLLTSRIGLRFGQGEPSRF